MPNTITVPFCFLPNSKVQVFDMDTCKRSEWQVNELLKVSQREDFAYFVIVHDSGRRLIMAPEYKSQCNILWYDKNGCMRVATLAEDGFIGDFDDWRKICKNAKPKPLDHVAYQSRTE